MYQTFTHAKWLTIIFFTFFLNQSFAQFPPESLYGVPIDPSDIPMPGYLQTQQDLDHALEITRLSDVTTFSNFYGFPISASSIRSQYSKIQTWNADMSLLHFGSIFFLNGDDYTINKKISWAGINDGRWSTTDPNILYFCTGSDFKKIDVISEQVTLIKTFPTYPNAGVGPWEGNLSVDNRYVVITNYNGNGEGIDASVYDIDNDVILGTFSGNFDWASMTPSGNYVVVSNNVTNQIERYDLNFQNMSLLISNQQHGDFGVDVNGDEVWVQVIPLSMVRLSDGVTTDLLPATASTSGTCGYNSYNPNMAGHISGRNTDLPGWAIVSAGTHPCSNGQGYDWRTEIFAIKLDYSGTGTIRHYGYSRTTASASIASVSPNGEKLLFMTDWDMYGNGDVDILSFLIEYNVALPVAWVSPLSAKIIGDHTQLSWTIADQKNNDKFIIEHSYDGSSFHAIGEVKGQTLSTIKTHQFIHKNPASGDHYYRIKQVDFDGQYEYSDIVQLAFAKGAISVFPVPANNHIIVQATTISEYAIYDRLGIKVKVGELHLGQNELDLSSLKPGLYFLKSGFGAISKIVLK